MADPTTPALASHALQLLIDAVDQTPAADWDQPSNLADWSLRDLVGHATGSAARIVALVNDDETPSGPSQPADWVAENPAAKLRELAERLRAALPGADLNAIRPSPQGPAPLHRALAFPVADLALHSWDLHRSQGRQVELPDDVLGFCRGLVDAVPEELLRRPGAFGPAQPVPAGATPTATLLAYLGRSVS